MKKLLFLILILLLTACNNEVRTDLERMGLTQDVSSFQQISRDPMGNEPLRMIYCNGYPLFPVAMVEFEDGFMVRETNFQYGKLLSTTEYTYDTNHLLMILNFTSYDGGYSFEQIHETEDDLVVLDDHIVNGVSTIDFTNSSRSFDFIYEYDNQMQVILTERRSDEDEDIYSIAYGYSKDGYIVNILGMINGERDFELNFDYDTQLCSGYQFESDIESFSYSFSYDFDDHNNWIEMRVHRDDVFSHTVTRTYNYKE